MRGRTTLIFAHRLSSVIGADRILALEHGRVVERGTHAELMARGGLYHRLMSMQAQRGPDDVMLLLDGAANGTAPVVAAPIAVDPGDARAAEVAAGPTEGIVRAEG